MNVILASSAIILVASLVACGGQTQEIFTELTTQSASLTNPGSADISLGGDKVTLIGGNSTSTTCSGAQFGFANGPCAVSVTYLVGARTVSFDWNYNTADKAGPGADIFGMIVDGRVVPISDPGGPQAQFGHIDIVAQNSLQLFLNCTDCTDGAATASVSLLSR